MKDRNNLHEAAQLKFGKEMCEIRYQQEPASEESEWLRAVEGGVTQNTHLEFLQGSIGSG